MYIYSTGVYQWKVNVMGPRNASGQFQHVLDNRLLAVSDVASPYIDDIAVGTRVEEGKTCQLNTTKNCVGYWI